MATRSATASSSSSQSSRLSWQPSHDANFHTARVGRGSSIVASSALPHPQRVGVPLVLGDDARDLIPHLGRIQLIEVNFPVFGDGRGYSAARIEEEVVVTEKGCEVISLFPAEDLPIANRY